MFLILMQIIKTLKLIIIYRGVVDINIQKIKEKIWIIISLNHKDMLSEQHLFTLNKNFGKVLAY